MGLGLAHALKHLRYQAGVHGLQHADGQGAHGLALEVAQRLDGLLHAINQRQRMVV